MIKILWQLPQILLAYILIILWSTKYEKTYKGIKIYKTHKLYGISLGTIIILYKNYNDLTLKHEYGHTKQSLIFGPLYLFIIGIPSLIMNILTRFKILKKENYFRRWPESWADLLGNITRSK